MGPLANGAPKLIDIEQNMSKLEREI